MADRSLETLYEAVRKGFNGKPDVTVRLTLESYNGNRYALWATYQEGSSKPDKSTSIREAELPALIAALQVAASKWCTPDTHFAGHLSDREYAAQLDWGGQKSSGTAAPCEPQMSVDVGANLTGPS